MKPMNPSNNQRGVVTLGCSSGTHALVVTNSSVIGLKTTQQEETHAQSWKPSQLPQSMEGSSSEMGSWLAGCPQAPPLPKAVSVTVSSTCDQLQYAIDPLLTANKRTWGPHCVGDDTDHFLRLPEVK